jgi:hypothetical protein
MGRSYKQPFFFMGGCEISHVAQSLGNFLAQNSMSTQQIFPKKFQKNL